MVAEYAANLVKKTIVGTGHAEKAQINAMLKVLLPKSHVTSPDAADALAVAITHAHHRSPPRLQAAVARAVGAPARPARKATTPPGSHAQRAHGAQPGYGDSAPHDSRASTKSTALPTVSRVFMSSPVIWTP